MHSYFKHFLVTFLHQISCKIRTSTAITCTHIKKSLQHTTSFIFISLCTIVLLLLRPHNYPSNAVFSLKYTPNPLFQTNPIFPSLSLFLPKNTITHFYTPAPSIPNPYITQNTTSFFPPKDTRQWRFSHNFVKTDMTDAPHPIASQ